MALATLSQFIDSYIKRFILFSINSVIMFFNDKGCFSKYFSLGNALR